MSSEKASEAVRVRKNVHELDNAEVELLKKAYNGIMALPVSDPKSYFSLAGKHGIPDGLCRHRTQQFLPWHRLYVWEFENALRSIDGCGKVTLPYIDPLHPKGTFAAWCSEHPFDSYTIPLDQHSKFELFSSDDELWNNGKTKRSDNAAIEQDLHVYQIHSLIKSAMDSKKWSEISNIDKDKQSQTALEAPHDQIHGIIGGWMGYVRIAAFDPIFWFHHSNIERLFCQWQMANNATTVDGLEKLKGLSKIEWSDSVPDLTFNNVFPKSLIWNPNVSYVYNHGPSNIVEESAISASAALVRSSFSLETKPLLVAKQLNSSSSSTTTTGTTASAASSATLVTVEPSFSIMIKNVDRSSIPGTFNIFIEVNGKLEVKICVFQIGIECDTCQENKLLSFARRLPGHITLPCKINVYYRDPNGNPVDVGTPSINVRAEVFTEEN